MAPINFRKGFTAAVAADQRVFEHDRTKTLGASEGGRCLRRSFFAKFEPDQAEAVSEEDIEWGDMERGNVIENAFAVPKLRKMFGEDKCKFMGEEQRTLVSGLISSTSDGLLVEQPRDALAEIPLSTFSGLDWSGIPDLGNDINDIAVEIKSIDPRADLHNVKPPHKFQNIGQMGLYRELTNYQPEYGIVLYFNPVNLKDIRPFTVKFDPVVMKSFRTRAEKLFKKGAKASDFRAEGKATGECAYCPFARHCAEEQIRVFPDDTIPFTKLSQHDQEHSKLLVSQVVTLRKKVKELEAEKKSIEEELKELMTDAGTQRVGEGGWSALYTKCNGKRGFDKETLTASFQRINRQLDDITEELIKANSTVLARKIAVINAELNTDRYVKEGAPYFRLTAKAGKEKE